MAVGLNSRPKEWIDLSGSPANATINAFSAGGTQLTSVNDTVMAGTGTDFVWGGPGDRIGVGTSTSAGGTHTFDHSTSIAGAAIAYEFGRQHDVHIAGRYGDDPDRARLDQLRDVQAVTASPMSGKAMNGRNRRNRAVATRPGEGPGSAPIRPIHGGRVRQRAGVRNGRADDARDPPCLDNDEIAGWRRRGHRDAVARGHRDADARRGARFYPGRWALPHHRDMAPFIPLWNECRRHLGLAGRLQPSRHVESGAMRTACSLAPSDARNTRRPAETPHRGHESADARDAGGKSSL